MLYYLQTQKEEQAMKKIIEILEKAAIITVLCFYVPSSLLNEALLYVILISFFFPFAQGISKALEERLSEKNFK